MRNCLVLFCLCLSFGIFSQTKSKKASVISTDTISKAKLRDLKLLSDLIKGIPATYESLAYDITYKQKGLDLKSIHYTGMELKPSLVNQISMAGIKSMMYIDLQIFTKNNISKRSYSFYIKE